MLLRILLFGRFSFIMPWTVNRIGMVPNNKQMALVVFRAYNTNHRINNICLLPIRYSDRRTLPNRKLVGNSFNFPHNSTQRFFSVGRIKRSLNWIFVIINKNNQKFDENGKKSGPNEKCNGVDGVWIEKIGMNLCSHLTAIISIFKGKLEKNFISYI